MMDNNDENNNNLNDKPEGDPEEVPYWLQGFDDDAHDKSTPIESDASEGSMWVNESEISASDGDIKPDPEEAGEPPYPQTKINDEAETADSDLSEGEMKIEETPDGSSNIDEEPIDAWEDREITDEIEIDKFPGDVDAEPVESAPDDPPSAEGFVDISDIDLPEPPEIEDDVILDVEAKEGELPEWLQEMISEPEEVEIDDSEIANITEEEIKESMDELDVNWEIEHLPEEISDDDLVVEDDISELDVTEVHEDLDVFMAIADEDTTPISTLRIDDISPEDEELGPIASESAEQVSEVSEMIEKENQLDEIKSYLNQGEIHQALKIINDLDEETTDIDEITLLLLEAAENETQDNSDAWEAIGDLAMKHEKPVEALDYYTKAIKLLLTNSEENHEIN